MKKFKKFLLSVLSLALVAVLSIGGTLAYLTSQDEDVNVMTLGNVKIVQNEQDRDGNEFEQGQWLLPIVKPTTVKDEAGYPADENYVDKIVTVKNTGKNDAYIRTLIAIPKTSYDEQDEGNASANVIHWQAYSKGDTQAPATRIPGEEGTVINNWSYGKDINASVWPGNYGDWNTFDVTIDGKEYEVYVATNLEIVEPGETTAPNMTGLYLDSRVDFDGTNYTLDGKVINGLDSKTEVLVFSQAVQARGFENAFDALNTAFGEPSSTNHPWMPKQISTIDWKDVQDAVTEKRVVINLTNNLGDEDQIIETSNTNLTINGNGYNVTAGDTGDYAGIHKNNSLVTYNNVNITSQGGGISAISGSKVTFNSGKVYVDTTNTSGRYNFYVVGEGSEVTINGGTFSFSSTKNQKRAYIYVGEGSTVYVNGGTFGKASTRDGYTAGILGNGTVIITGGTFGFDPSNWVATGYVATKTGSTWTVQAE